MTRTSLPPGFRFHPTDVELVMYFLKRKVFGKRNRFEVIAEVDIYKFAPWDLPDKSSLRSKDLEWFFFCPREKKYSNGSRMNRTTEYGFWKTTGKDRSIIHNEQTVGMIKTLIFHLGKAPKGDRTDWVMHEYRLEDKSLAAQVVQDAFVICKIFQKTGPGPRNGAQYGAPFNEEEWSDVEMESFSLAGPSDLAPIVQPNEDCTVQTDTVGSGISVCIGTSSDLTPTKTVEESFTGHVLGHVQAEDVSLLSNPLISDEDMVSMLECFNDDTENHRKENLDNVKGKGNNETSSPAEGNDIFNDLGELGNWPELTENASFSNNGSDFTTNQRQHAFENGWYLELNDLEWPLGGGGGSYLEPPSSLHHNFSNNNCSKPQQQPCYFDSVLPEGSYGCGNHLVAYQPDINGNQRYAAHTRRSDANVAVAVAVGDEQELVGDKYIQEVDLYAPSGVESGFFFNL